MKSKSILMALGLILVLFSYSFAQVPQMINYQGKLTKSSGAPLDTTIAMVFSIYADSNGITLKWTETQGAVKVEKGVFNVLLGSTNPIPDTVFDGSIRYLGVKVGGDPEITPRKAMVSVPYAYKAFESDTADYALSAPSQWMTNGSNIYYNSGSVGIGTTSPAGKLHLQEAADGTLHNTLNLYDLRPVGNTVPGEGPGIYLSVCNAPGSGAGQSNAAIFGVRGANNASTDFAVYAGTTSGYSERLRILGTNGNVGIGTASPSQKLDVAGTAQMTGIKMTTSPTTGYVLTSDASGNGTWQQKGLPSGTTGQTLRHDGTGWIANSALFNDGTNVGIGTASPQGALDVSSTTGAFIVPRMTTDQRDALTAVNGMIIYNTTTNQFNFYENGAWVTK